ncbi:protein ALTERED XYLOGLUCAN 9 [Typha angustifolia]|uniref:protein ALTERED XYLOGLUCAN 9 n=1 Tax=Typha angustifolia TaxID=59011 RepID=UPI003C2C1E63
MVPPAQLGVFAACVVLFVPMGMAGYHLSRNKMLFFSGALFITLAVGVHLTPYFPSSISHLFFLPSSSYSHHHLHFSPLHLLPPPSSCLPFLHRISWTRSASPPSWSWSPSSPSRSCGFQRLSRSDASDLLNGSWILVAGDSQARLLVLAVLRLLLDPASMASVEPDLFRRHSDYHLAIADRGIKIDFIWAPFESNITRFLRHDLRHTPRYPDVLVLGSGLWHMLHSTNSTNYGEELDELRRAVRSLLLPVSPHMFWLGLPTLVNSMLNTEDKRERMNLTVCEAYNHEVEERRILRRSGGPLLLLDVGLLSRGCGQQCTADGMHYDGVVYEAAFHIMLNALLIDSQQRI